MRTAIAIWYIFYFHAVYISRRGWVNQHSPCLLPDESLAHRTTPRSQSLETHEFDSGRNLLLFCRNIKKQKWQYNHAFASIPGTRMHGG
jgi:hypothetical protein